MIRFGLCFKVAGYESEISYGLNFVIIKNYFELKNKKKSVSVLIFSLPYRR